MNEEANRPPNQQEDKPSQVQPARPASKRARAGAPAWQKKVLVALVVCGLGVAAYLIVPEIASSASLEQARQDVQELRQRLAEAETARNKLAAEQVDLKTELNETLKRAKDAETNLAAHKLKTAAAEKFITQLSSNLEEVQQAHNVTRGKLDAAEKVAEQAKAASDKAESRAASLATNLATVQKRAQDLDEAKRALQTDNAELSADLETSMARRGELRRLLNALAFGEAPAEPAKPSWPAEMPITEKELVACMGDPSVSFENGRRLDMKWGEAHSARVVDGVVTQIDGSPATRAVLKSVAVHRLTPTPAPASWRVAQDGRLHYADLVSMFGPPERVAGTGKHFTAWWTIGAWARKACAMVAEGVVTQFDGKTVDPAGCCELVRHRAQAYDTANEAVQAEVAAARDFYKRASALVAAELNREAEKLRRDGIVLQEWKLAPFDSVQTWVARTNAPAGSVTLRTAVDCTWVDLRGEKTTLRRFVVVRMVSKAEGMERAEYAIFQGRD